MLYESFYSAEHLSMHLRLLCHFSFLNDFTEIKVASHNSCLCLLIRAGLMVDWVRREKHFYEQFDLGESLDSPKNFAVEEKFSVMGRIF